MAADARGFLYGRVVAEDGTYEGRLRFGGGQEAFWNDAFNGFKPKNEWAAFVAPERLPRQRRGFALFGIEIAAREVRLRLGRQFLTRFGDLAKVERRGRHVFVTIKSGTVYDLDLHGASDFDDGVRVWVAGRGPVDLDSREIRSIELLATPPLADAPARLHGTVRTKRGEFTGFVTWNREECVATDELGGVSERGEVALRFDTIRAIARREPRGASVTLADGRELALHGAQEVDRSNRGVYVDDRRYGRVLVHWSAFERVDFDAAGAAGSGPAYGDFAPGARLAGAVVTRAGRRLAGRLVFDLDESETTDSLDGSRDGVDYLLPFGAVAAIELPPGDATAAARARVVLRGGEALELERAGDLGEQNAGVLVFGDDPRRAEYVPWPEVARIDFESK